MVSISELIERKEQIESLIKEFNHKWGRHCTSAIVWELPIMAEQLAPNAIEVRRIDSEKAMHLTTKALLSFKRIENQHPATVIRLPGIIRLSQSYYGKVSEINAYKDYLKQRMQSVHPRTRPRLARTAWPSVSTLQLYRHIAAPYSSKRKVLFSWVGSTTSSTRTTRDTMIRSVELARTLVPEGVSVNDWNKTIDIELKELASLPLNAHLVLQKRVAPHPRVMVYHGEEKQPTRTYGANLPIFIPDKPTMIVSELKNWDRETALIRKRRKDKHVSKIIISRLNLYLRAG